MIYNKNVYRIAYVVSVYSFGFLLLLNLIWLEYAGPFYLLFVIYFCVLSLLPMIDDSFASIITPEPRQKSLERYIAPPLVIPTPIPCPTVDIDNINGCVYLLRRRDGIYKVGRTINLPQRLKGLRRDYGQSFEVISVWEADNLSVAEKRALRATREFRYIEDGRKELRQAPEQILLNHINEVLT